MAEHEHTRTIHLYHIELPYGQSGQDLEFEPGSIAADIVEVFEALAGEYSEDETRRVLTGAVALIAKYPHRRLADALHTAMVWERG